MIRILHLYPELLNLYGEYANVAILTRYLREEGAEVEVSFVSLGEEIPDGYDMLYIGCGTEKASLRALEALIPYCDIIKEYCRHGAILLATGNSFDLFGKEIVDETGEAHPGLNLFDYSVKRTRDNRFLGDAVLSCYAFFGRVIGFVNKSSTIYGVETPLFHAEMGYGNDNVSSDEGLLSDGFIGTSLIGPLLVRNPLFCSYIMERLYEKTGFTPTRDADMTLQKEAYAVSLRELTARMK